MHCPLQSRSAASPFNKPTSIASGRLSARTASETWKNCDGQRKKSAADTRGITFSEFGQTT